MSHYSIRRVVAAIAVLVIAVFAYRAVTLRSLEPRWDQASFAVWVQDIRQSDHLLPERAPGESFQSALQADSSSAAHQLTLRLYNKHHNLFTAASLAALSVLVSAFNVRYETQVVATIGVSALVAGVVAWFLLVSLIADLWFRFAAALIASAAVGTSVYLHYFSAFGVHNFGIMALYSAMLVTQLAVSATENGRVRTITALTLVSIASIVAVYSHWTNIFIALPATAVALLLTGTRTSYRQALLRAGVYTFVSALCVGVPFVLLRAISAHSGSSDFAYARLGAAEILLGLLPRIGNWFSTGATLFSIPGLVLGIAGLIMLGVRHRVWVPLLIAAAHLTAWSLMPGFSWNGSNSGLRTYPYVLPAFCLGIGWVTAAAFRALSSGRERNVVLGAAICGAALFHFVLQFQAVLKPEVAAARMPEFWADYMEGQGTMRPVARATEEALSDNGYFLAWDYRLKDTIRCLTSRRLPGYALPTVETVLARAKAGDIGHYVRARRLIVPENEPVIIVAQASANPQEMRPTVKQVLASLGARSAGELELLRAWDTHAAEYRAINLLRFEPSPD